VDPLTLGIVVFFLVGYVCKEVGKAVAEGYRGAAKSARQKTAAMRASNNPTDEALGWIGEQLGKVIGGTVRAAGGLAGAVARGAKSGWQAGQEKGRQIRDDAKAKGRSRWREAADWARDRVQGRPREQHRSLRQRLRDWWNEGREDDPAQTDRPDDPPADGDPGTGGPPPPPGPTGTSPSPGDPAPPVLPVAPGSQPGEPQGPSTITDPPSESQRPAAEDCPHTNTTTGQTTGTVTCDDCGMIFGAGTTPGGDMSAPTTAPSGEVQTYTQALAVEADYRRQAVRYQESAVEAKTRIERFVTSLRAVRDQLQAGGLGERTMTPLSGALEQAEATLRGIQQLIVDSAAAATAADRVTSALTTHAGIAEAAALNSDGGDRLFHGGAAETR
jgi:gas vesicle protein